MKTHHLLLLLVALPACGEVDGSSSRGGAIRPDAEPASAAEAPAPADGALSQADGDGVLIPPPPVQTATSDPESDPEVEGLRPSREVRMAEAAANREKQRGELARSLDLRADQDPGKVIAGPNSRERARDIAENMRASRMKSAAIVRKKVLVKQKLKRARRTRDRAADDQSY